MQIALGRQGKELEEAFATKERQTTDELRNRWQYKVLIMEAQQKLTAETQAAAAWGDVAQVQGSSAQAEAEQHVRNAELECQNLRSQLEKSEIENMKEVEMADEISQFA